MEHTKGDWEKVGNKIQVFHRGTIAVCPSPKDGGVIEFVANARLIAAAPRMAEVLNDIVKAASFCHADAGLKIWIDEAKEILKRRVNEIR